MSAFLTPLRFEDRTGCDGPRFALLFPLEYQSDRLQTRISVPVGFLTDLASIPQVLWNVLPPVGAYDRAAVLHDYLYQHGAGSRADADRVLNEAMTVCAVSRWQRWLIWSGVRVGGWVPWNRYRKADMVPV